MEILEHLAAFNLLNFSILLIVFVVDKPFLKPKEKISPHFS